MDFTFSHDHTRDLAKTHGELSWARNQKIVYDFDLKKPNGWKNLEVSSTGDF